MVDVDIEWIEFFIAMFIGVRIETFLVIINVKYVAVIFLIYINLVIL